MGPCSNPIPAGRAAAACAAFHNSGGFLGREGGRAAFLHGQGHQRRRATSKATQSLGVDDCNPPFGPLLATSTPQPSNTCTHTEWAARARYVHPPASLLPPQAHQPFCRSINHSSLSSDIDFCFMVRAEEGRAGAGDATDIWGVAGSGHNLSAQTLNVQTKQ